MMVSEIGLILCGGRIGVGSGSGVGSSTQSKD